MTEFKSKDQELMTITMEECGELIQGFRSKSFIWCGTYDNNDSLKEELCDVMCMIELLVERGCIKVRIEQWVSVKETQID